MAMIDFPTSPTSGQEFTLGNVTWTWDGVKWTAYPGALAIPDAPVDGQQYARQNASWSVVAGGGGGIADAPIDGTLYGRKSAAWTHLSHTDITDWTAALAPYALTTSVPAASSSSPLMDGTAAAGTGTTFARADHIHPTDTSRAAASALASYAPLASPALTGNPTAPTPTAGDNDTSLATTAFVTTAIAAQPVAIGDNRIINGNFAINQRGYVSGTALPASPTVANGYGHDRWKAGAGGCTYTFTVAVPDTTITITANTLTQIIEAGMIEGGVFTLSWTGTAQARVWQGTAAGSYAASPVTTAALTAGTNTVVEFNAGTLTRVKLEIGSVATPFNRQSLTKSLADCQRYYAADGTVMLVGFNSWAANAFFVNSIALPVYMRGTPTIVLGSQSGSSNISNAAVNGASSARFGINYTATAAGGSSLTITGFTASAEL